MMIVWWMGALAPRARLAVRGATALAICFAVEASQLYHAPTVDAIRRTQLGQLILGNDFDPRDLAAYAAGVAGAVLLESIVLARGGRPRAVT